MRNLLEVGLAKVDDEFAPDFIWGQVSGIADDPNLLALDKWRVFPP